MTTKAEVESRLAELPLTAAVAVADTADVRTGAARRSYSYTTAKGNVVTIEIDADPSPAQLADLARHLPLADKDRPAALDKLSGESTAKVTP